MKKFEVWFKATGEGEITLGSFREDKQVTHKYFKGNEVGGYVTGDHIVDVALTHGRYHNLILYYIDGRPV
jgi:hypothetical protein